MRIPLRPERIAFEPSHHRAVIVELALTPGLVEARWRGCEKFPDSCRTPYRPHLSLLYADLGEDEKRAMVAGVEVGPPFEAVELALYDTGGPVEGWRCLAAFPLG